MEIRKYTLLILFIVAIGFLLGWIFPVEGPVDYIYDNYKAQKCATKNGPLIVGPSEELNFEEEEYVLKIIMGDAE